MKVLVRWTWIVGAVLTTTTSCVKEEHYPTKILKKASAHHLKDFNDNFAASHGAADSLDENHFTLKIIGVPKGKHVEVKAADAIYINADDDPIIWLQGGKFRVLDADGADGLAFIQLPKKNVLAKYAVHAVPIGSSRSSSTTAICATDLLTGKVICSQAEYVSLDDELPLIDISEQLLYVHADVNHDGVAARFPLFHSNLENYFWKYDKNGLKVLRVQFSEILPK